MKTVEQFYFDCDLLPISARVNLYDTDSKKRILEDYQDTKNTETSEYDNRFVRGYRYNPKTNLLMIWC